MGYYSDFLEFSVSSNAISIVATHIHFYFDLFALISFKRRRLKGRIKLSFLNILKNCQFSKLHIFQVINN